MTAVVESGIVSETKENHMTKNDDCFATCPFCNSELSESEVDLSDGDCPYCAVSLKGAEKLWPKTEKKRVNYMNPDREKIKKLRYNLERFIHLDIEIVKLNNEIRRLQVMHAYETNYKDQEEMFNLHGIDYSIRRYQGWIEETESQMSEMTLKLEHMKRQKRYTDAVKLSEEE